MLKFQNECLIQSHIRNSVKIYFPQNWNIYDSYVHSLSHTFTLPKLCITKLIKTTRTPQNIDYVKYNFVYFHSNSLKCLV